MTPFDDSSGIDSTPLAYVLSCVTKAPHLGRHFVNAAGELGLSAKVADQSQAWNAPKWVSRVCWHLLDKRAPYGGVFEREVLRLCDANVGGLISTGLAPLQAPLLRELRQRGVVSANYSTDDPWNPKNGAGWFFRSLREYDIVFSPRRANFADLNRLGCRRVEYLPFAYDPATHFPEAAAPENAPNLECDVAFTGGGDEDRLPYVNALRDAGLKVRVYGHGWERFPEWRSAWGGLVFNGAYRQAVAHGRVQLSLVRRANRDGHVMRSFELAAMRCCILSEDTPEHRDIYGPPEAGHVAYFTTYEEMISEAKRLLADPDARQRMAGSAFDHVVKRTPNTYRDRLARMVEIMAIERERRTIRGSSPEGGLRSLHKEA